jgi:hypothetical protein
MLTACKTSQSALVVAREDQQRGAVGNVYMNDGRQFIGELLALDDSTVVLLTGGHIAIGALPRVARLAFDDFETTDVGPRHRMSPRTLAEGKRASRFPFGTIEHIMASLLVAMKQTSPDRLESMTP